MIRVNNVVKTFGDFRALDGVNLYVRDGAIYGLVGRTERSREIYDNKTYYRNL